MIPYIELERIPYVHSDPFSFFLFLAYLIGYLYLLYRGIQGGFRFREITELFLFTYVPALFGAHVFHYVAYAPLAMMENPTLLLQPTVGLASSGGMLSFLLFFFLYVRLTGKSKQWLQLFDLLVQSGIVGLGVGRIGCALIHDHPGVLSDFILAVQFPAGARHDLGLYELLYISLVVFPISYYVHIKKLRPGSQFVAFAFSYGVFRVLAEFLRINDARYMGFTPAQYTSLFLISLGFLFYRSTILFEKRGSV